MRSSHEPEAACPAQRPGRALVGAAFVAAALASRSSAAQEIYLTGPLAGACIARRDHYSVPARYEWAFWNAGGVSLAPRDGRVEPVIGVGAEVTSQLVAAGPPDPKVRAHGNYGELRFGLWGLAQTRAERGLVEAGVMLHLGVTNDHIAVLFDTAPLGMST